MTQPPIPTLNFALDETAPIAWVVAGEKLR
jgi:hypothetical protein